MEVAVIARDDDHEVLSAKIGGTRVNPGSFHEEHILVDLPETQEETLAFLAKLGRFTVERPRPKIYEIRRYVFAPANMWVFHTQNSYD